MRNRTTYERALGGAGFALGLCAVALALVGWRVPTVRPDLGAEAAFSATPTGELEVTPVGVFLDAKGLLPGGPAASGRLAVRNQTGRTLFVSLRALPAARDLDELLSVVLTDGAKTLFRGRLSGLRDWTMPVGLAPGGIAPLRLRVSIPTEVTSGYRARIVSIPIELRSTRTP